MHQLLSLGLRVSTSSGHIGTVQQFIGGGGQGEVYQMQMDQQSVALKWYFPEQATGAQRQSLELLCRKGPPSDCFLWPLELVTAPQVPGFGYIMPLRDAKFKGIVDLMKRRIEPSFRSLATAGLKLAQAFLALHAQGLCYRDISFGNVFFDPASGAIQICDNDNVAVDDQTLADDQRVLGTPRFIAPEVVRGEAAPSTQTDLFSLSVLLFYLLHIHHPLEGQREAVIKCFDLPAMNRLYGSEPLFIFDPNDASNRPVVGIHDNALAYWALYPRFLRERFIQAFTLGLHDPLARVRESEWRATLAQLQDAIFYCGHCGAENFYESTLPRAAPCWSCRAALQIPFQLQVGRDLVMLNHNTQLFAHHLDPQRRYEFSTPWARVQQHPQQPTRWGLTNRSSSKWVMTNPQGTVRDVEPGRSVALAAGVKIQFGLVDGEILAS